MADFYSTQKYQIRLAVSPEDAAMLDFSKKAPVMLENPLMPDLPPIAATMERTEGEIDRQTRSLVIVAEFENANQLPGAYFKAKLPAKAYTQVKKLPRRCLREDSHLWSVSPARTLHKQTLTIVRREQDTIYFSGGPEPQTEVLASVLPATTEGMAVRLVEPKK